MNEVGKDLPALVALVRTQDRLYRQKPGIKLDVDVYASRFSSEDSRRLCRAILGDATDTSPEVKAKADAIKRLALGNSAI